MPPVNPPQESLSTPIVQLTHPNEAIVKDDAAHPDTQKMCRDTVFFAGDEQYHSIAYNWGLFRSQAINSEAPGHRLPGSNSGLFAGHEAIIRQAYTTYIPKICRQDFYKGIISTGDTTDIATIEEFNSFLNTQKRLQKHSKKHQILAYLIGNHEVLHSGTARSGTDFFGVLGWFLKLEGKRTYHNDIQLPEAGSEGNILNKEKLIALIYKNLGGGTPSPIVVTETDDARYRISHGAQLDWNQTEEVYNNFWRSSGDDVWQLLIRYRPLGYAKDNSEAEWIYAPAVKMGEYKTPKGSMPLYLVGLDTMDYTSRRSSLGAINGHVSPLQIKAIKSFIEQKKKENPLAKFMLAGHYKPSSIDEVQYAGLNKLLEDDAIIAVIGAHHHKRDFVDLHDKSWQEKLDFVRQTVLPEITVPAIIDWPNEIMGMQYGLVGSDFVVDFDFLGIDQSKIPGVDNEVERIFKEILPQLLSYRDAVKHIKDPRIREFATPGTSLERKIQLIVHPDYGLIADEGRLHDHLVAQDVLPTMVEDAQLYLRIAENVLYLTLTEAGLKSEGEKLRSAYYDNQDVLDAYYERIWKGDYTQLIDHSPFHELDQKTADVETAVQFVLVAIDKKLNSDPTTTNKQRELLEKIKHVVSDTHRFQENYKYWLQRYENLKRSNRSDADLVFAADIFASGYFRSIQQHIEMLPYGSKAHAFMTLIFLESAKERDIYYKRNLSVSVPDHIRLTIQANGRRVLQPKSKAEFQSTIVKQVAVPEEFPPQMNPDENPPEVFVDPRPEEHWVLRAGGSFLQGNQSFTGYVGGRWHLLEGLKVPRLSWEMVTGIKSDGIHGVESPLLFSFNIGDPFGLIDVGPLFGGGLAYTSGGIPFMGVGGQANIREGLLSFNFLHKWYYEKRQNDWSPNWELTFHTDLFTWMRFFDILPPGF